MELRISRDHHGRGLELGFRGPDPRLDVLVQLMLGVRPRPQTAMYLRQAHAPVVRADALGRR